MSGEIRPSSSEHHENKIESHAPFALVTGVQNGSRRFPRLSSELTRLGSFRFMYDAIKWYVCRRSRSHHTGTRSDYCSVKSKFICVETRGEQPEVIVEDRQRGIPLKADEFREMSLEDV